MAAREQFERHKLDLGYAMLLKRYVADPRTATPDQIIQAAWSTVPNVPVMFWVFRVMAGLGFVFIAFFLMAFYFSTVRRFDARWFLRVAVWIIPCPGSPPSSAGSWRRSGANPGRSRACCQPSWVRPA
jgi:cytochrome d ubiquinol oxidase subunit I